MSNQGRQTVGKRKSNQGVVLVSMLGLLLIAGAGAWVMFGPHGTGGPKQSPKPSPKQSTKQSTVKSESRSQLEGTR